MDALDNLDVTPLVYPPASHRAGGYLYMKSQNKIAIIGKCNDTRFAAPFDDKDVDVWTFSPTVDNGECDRDLQRWDVWFDVHDLGYVETCAPGYREWLAKQKKPVYLSRGYSDQPNANVFPLDTVKNLTPYPYFNNTVSYVLALAISTNPEWIGLFGVNMAARSEYGHQRPSCEYWLGVAAGMGINVYLPPASDLLKSGRLYGFEQTDMAAKVKARKSELEQRKANFEIEKEEVKNLGIAAQGALKEIEFWKTKLNGDFTSEMTQREEILTQQAGNCQAIHQQRHDDMKRVEGALENLEWSEQWA